MNNEFPIRPIGIVGYPRVEILDITGPSEVFFFTSDFLRQRGLIHPTLYPMTVLAKKSGLITTLSGLRIFADQSYLDVDSEFDTLLIPGSLPKYVLSDRNLLNWLKKAAPKARRIVAVCTGAYLLAECGLLDGRKATTHWHYCRDFSKTYRNVSVEADKLFVKDGNVVTSGGVTSGIDLALSLVEEDWGPEVALQVARFMVVFLKRPGGQSQFSNYLELEAPTRADLHELQIWIMQNPEKDLRVETLAERMAMSERNFGRLFFNETGFTPAKFVEMVRTNAARQLLTSTTFSIEVIAEKSGFKDPERMRRTFLRQVGINPSDYRKRFSISEINNNVSSVESVRGHQGEMIVSRNFLKGQRKGLREEWKRNYWRKKFKDNP